MHSIERHTLRKQVSIPFGIIKELIPGNLWSVCFDFDKQNRLNGQTKISVHITVLGIIKNKRTKINVVPFVLFGPWFFKVYIDRDSSRSDTCRFALFSSLIMDCAWVVVVRFYIHMFINLLTKMCVGVCMYFRWRCVLPRVKLCVVWNM